MLLNSGFETDEGRNNGYGC
jgi:hypothetical protein